MSKSPHSPPESTPEGSSAGSGPSGLGDLVALDQDHPGFRDPAYRQRRNTIARLALNFRLGDPVPSAEYTDAEHGVWQHVTQKLSPLHEQYACAPYLRSAAQVKLPSDRIPQLSAVNIAIASSGFCLLPVGGLMTPRQFLGFLADGHFLATQYIRHHSRPLYTPEPDVVHELVGHAAFMLDPDVVWLSRAFGQAARTANETRIDELIRLYWYTLEFGVVRQGEALKVVGAGLLSSFGELGQFQSKAELRTFDIDAIVATPFDPTDYQGVLYVAPSFEALVDALTRWLSPKS